MAGGADTLTIIFFNAKSYTKAEDEDVREFLRYVNGEKSENPFVQVIDNKVAKVKSSKEWRREYMTLLMRERDIEKRTRAEDIQTLIASLRFFGISDEEILQQLVERYHLTSDKANEFLN